MLPQRPDWMTDQLIGIEAELDEARHALSATVERAVQSAEKALAGSPPLTDEELAAFHEAREKHLAANQPPAEQDEEYYEDGGTIFR